MADKPLIYIANQESFMATLQRAREACQDLTVPLMLIAKDWMKSNQAMFQLKGPGQWADLSNGKGKRTIRGLGPKATGEKAGIGGYKWQKLKRWGFIYPILRASGKLESSLTDPSDPNALTEVVNRDMLLLGTRVLSKAGASYPTFLYYGTKFMPARPFLFIPDDRLGRWSNTINEFVLKNLKAPGTNVDKG